MPLKLIPISVLVLALAVLACVTINVYFPEAEVKDLSEKIEDAVEKEASDEGQEEPATEPEEPQTSEAQVSLLGAVLALISPTPAWADQGGVATPDISNPAIRKIVQSRGRRVREIQKQKKAGLLGENNKGFLQARGLEELGLQERAAVQKLLKDENADRKRMYQEIAAAKNLDPSQVDRVGETYAATLRKRAQYGDWVQMPDGKWKQAG